MPLGTSSTSCFAEPDWSPISAMVVLSVLRHVELKRLRDQVELRGFVEFRFMCRHSDELSK